MSARAGGEKCRSYPCSWKSMAGLTSLHRVCAVYACRFNSRSAAPCLDLKGWCGGERTKAEPYTALVDGACISRSGPTSGACP
jgi:hypothetical protein